MSFAESISEKRSASQSNKLLIGWAKKDITPTKPVALAGQFHVRISKSVHDPIMATALAISARRENGEREQAIMVSCDLVGIKQGIQDKLREILKPKSSGLEMLLLLRIHLNCFLILDYVLRLEVRHCRLLSFN